MKALLRGAQVITMTPGRPDWERVDVLVEGTRIADVGRDLDGGDAEVLDLSGRVVMPGLVNAHLHTWQTGLRTVGVDWTLSRYLTLAHGTLAGYYRPEDMRIASLAGALSQLNSGVTTVGDWCHNTPTPEHSDAAIEGFLRSGIRTVFLHGRRYSLPEPHPVTEIDRLLARSHELLTVGMAIPGPQLSPADVAVADFRAAAERGIVVSMHQSGGDPQPAWDVVREARLFGPLTNIVHGAGLTDSWTRTLVDAGVSFTTTAENELGQGHGAPITARLLPIGAAPSLGTDTDAVVPGDLLVSARVALAQQRGLDHDHHRQAHGVFSHEPTVTAMQALRWATVEGARALGLADDVGRLEPGMRADLIAVDARALNLWPAHDPVAAALHAGVGDIESVMVAGRWRKRDHTLVDVEVERVKEELADSAGHIVAALGATRS
ncbi:amidohydrolase family protein [Pseudonocardia spinosispora]|uniref:amidohydrolase family protein n=1 Tax=Pseudonocardia spinosispora TaxID=103441 RepID=UPI001B7FC795|nr:amidohydrolase family protein [Pseudonocardia spinosispora]